MRPRGQSPGLPTVDELPSEENRGRLAEAQRRAQTGYGQRPRAAEDYQPLPPQDRFDPRSREAGLLRTLASKRAPPEDFQEEYAPETYEAETPPMHSKFFPKPPEPYTQRPEPTVTGTLPYNSRIRPPQSARPVGQYEQLVGAFQSSMKDLTAKMDRSFQQMSSKLYQMSTRLDSVKGRVENMEGRENRDSEEQPMQELKKSFIHPPVTTIAATQTVSNAEVQVSESSSLQRKPSDVPSRNPPSQHSKVQSFQSSNATPILREPEAKVRDFETQTPVDRSGTVQEEMVDQLTTMWLETLELLKANNLKAAYRKVLETGDDIYLLRLIHKTGVCLKELDVTTGLTVIRRLGQIMHSYFLESLGLQWIEETVQKGVFQQLPGDVQKGLIDALYAMSAMPNDEGVAAAQLYTYLTSPPA